MTITLEEETARWLRIEAARQDMSMSRLIAQVLQERLARSDDYEAARRRYFSQEPRVHRRPGQRLPARDELHERHDLR